MNNKKMNAKDILGDCLITEKHLTETYNEAANESTGDDFRSDMMGILAEEHQLQSAVFHFMNRRGFYKVQQADDQEIDALRRRLTKKGL